jgi:hypothetical protein
VGDRSGVGYVNEASDALRLVRIVGVLMVIAIGLLVWSGIRSREAVQSVQDSRLQSCQETNARRAKALSIIGAQPRPNPVMLQVVEVALPKRNCKLAVGDVPRSFP